MLSDDALKQACFSDLDMMFYAGAALPPDIWADMDRLAQQVRGNSVMLTTCWGMTETAPACIFQHEPASVAGLIGAPLPGVQLKLVPEQGERYELRVKGPNITPGYYRDPDRTAGEFDEEGFFLTGDAVSMADPTNASAGLRFAGRIAEDFKLATGTWVRATALRLELLSTLKPLVQDVILTGEGQHEAGVMILPSPTVLSDSRNASDGLLDDSGYATRIVERLEPFAAAGRGSAGRITRAIILSEPPSMAAGEVTAKGNLNFSRILANREQLLKRLYDDDDPAVLHLTI